MNASTHVAPNMGDLYSLLYIMFAALSALYLAKNTEYKFITFILIFWLLAQPVIQAFYVIRPTFLPFDFQPNRILLIFLVGILLFKSIIVKRNLSPIQRQSTPFVVYLILFIVLIAIAMGVNANVLGLKRIFAIPLEPITFLLLFIVARILITENILRAVLYAILIMSTVSALIAIYQVIADPMFLRTGTPRLAFGNIYRAFGVFPTEYIFGSFQLIAIFVALAVISNQLIRNITIAILSVSVFITFHRLDLIILTVLAFLYMTKFSRKKVGVPMIILLGLVAVSILPAYSIFKSFEGESQLVAERLSADTVSGRFEQYWVVINALPKHPLGLGSYEHPEYQSLMIKHKMTQSIKKPDGTNQVEGLGVHNGFLGVGIKYGFLAMIIFILFFWKMFQYFYRRANRFEPLTYVPMFAVIIWIMSNISNGIINFSSYNILIVGLLAGAFVGLYEKGLLNKKDKVNDTSVCS